MTERKINKRTRIFNYELIDKINEFELNDQHLHHHMPTDDEVKKYYDHFNSYNDRENEITTKINEFANSLNELKEIRYTNDKLLEMYENGEFDITGKEYIKGDDPLSATYAKFYNHLLHETEFGEKYNKFREYAKQIKAGYDGEKRITDALEERALVKGEILCNIMFGKQENDVIIVDTKGIFTIEIKNHYSEMVWENNGTFKEYFKKEGKIVEGKAPEDPYLQAQRHKIALRDGLLSLGEYKINAYVVLANYFNTPKSKDEVILSHVVTLEKFLEIFEDSEDVYTLEEVKKITSYIKRHKGKLRTYPFYDVLQAKKMINDFLLENKIDYDDICSDEHAEVSQYIREYATTCRNKQIYEEISGAECKLKDGFARYKLEDKIGLFTPIKSLLFTIPLILYFAVITIPLKLYAGFPIDGFKAGIIIVLIIRVLYVLFVKNGRKYALSKGYSEIDVDISAIMLENKRLYNGFVHDQTLFKDGDEKKFDNIKNTFLANYVSNYEALKKEVALKDKLFKNK